ncbi:MAG TPA: hypothetical protein VE084_08350 [Burkholderiaceae bacterium]|nr:hypothetical protein [Burkholderiaceae bacterium]
MATTVLSERENESWDLGDQRWSRDPATGAFELLGYRQLGTPGAAADPLDWAGLVGARLSHDPADCAGRPLALFPGEFRYSPTTGHPLAAAPHRGTEVWLPPFGGERDGAQRLQGLRLTAARLSLPGSLTPEANPDDELPPPCEGPCHFIVAAFSACESRLVALDVARGTLRQWLPHSRRWAELAPVGDARLSASSLGDDAWSLAALEQQGTLRLFLPSDDGLAVVGINLLAGRCEVHMLGSTCVGAPVLWRGRVHVPMLDREGVVFVQAVRPDDLALERMPVSGLDPAAHRWLRPVADPQRIVWMGSRGQLLVRAEAAGPAGAASFLPWPAGIAPRFDLGGPSLAAGHLWQPCFLRDAQGGRVVSVQLGAAGPALRDPAGDDPDEDDDGSTARERSAILLASTTSSATLRARLDDARRVSSGFGSRESYLTTFELAGEDTVAFFAARLSRPWATQAFLYAGRLYLHHPELPVLPGWQCAA